MPRIGHYVFECWVSTSTSKAQAITNSQFPLSPAHFCPNATISKFGYFPTLGVYLEMSLAPSGSPLARVVSVVLDGCIFPTGNASTPDQLEGYRLRGNALIHVSEINLSRLAGLCCAPVLSVPAL